MVVSALMILLQGRILNWGESKKLMSNGERFINMLLDYDPDSITPTQLTLLRPFEANPNFHPDAVNPICHCAAKFLSWVIGMLNAYRWRRGTNHGRIDPLQTSMLQNSESPGAVERKMPKIAFAGRGDVSANLGSFSFVEKMERRRTERELLEKENSISSSSRPMTSPVKRPKKGDGAELGSMWAEVRAEKSRLRVI